MSDPTDRPDRAKPTSGQRTILEGLHLACRAVLMQDEPPRDLTPGAQIAWFTGVLSATIDTLGARGDLYARAELYSPPAVRGYVEALRDLFHAQPRSGIAYRLTAYCNIVHPAGLDVSVDPATSAIQQAMKAAAMMLHATAATDARTPAAEELTAARRILVSAVRYVTEAISAAEAVGGDRA
jgi:hypothetical protein